MSEIYKSLTEVKDIIVGAAVVLAFALGMLLGGMIHAAKVAPMIKVGRQCLESAGYINAVAFDITNSIAEVNHAREGYLLLGGGPLQSGDKPRLRAMHEGKGGQ